MSEGPDDLDQAKLAHELRNTLAAIDMLLEAAIEEASAKGDPRALITKARVGVIETLDLIVERLERPKPPDA